MTLKFSRVLEVVEVHVRANFIMTSVADQPFLSCRVNIGCRTTVQLIWDKLTSNLNSLKGCWRQFCLGVAIAAHCGCS